MSRYKTPAVPRRTLCGVPPDNHEVAPSHTVYFDGAWTCRNVNCEFLGTQEGATRHIVVTQFTMPRDER